MSAVCQHSRCCSQKGNTACCPCQRGRSTHNEELHDSRFASLLQYVKTTFSQAQFYNRSPVSEIHSRGPVPSTNIKGVMHMNVPNTAKISLRASLVLFMVSPGVALVVSF